MHRGAGKHRLVVQVPLQVLHQTVDGLVRRARSFSKDFMTIQFQIAEWLCEAARAWNCGTWQSPSASRRAY